MKSLNPTLELTFAIVKPHIIKFPHALQALRTEIVSSGFYVVRSKRCLISPEEADQFYLEHKEKFFHRRLLDFITSGPVDCYLLARENGVEKWRELMGPTKVFKTQFSHPQSIRGRFGLSDTRNATHGSDSFASVIKECSLLFPEFNITKWYEKEEWYFKNGWISFDESNFIHKIIEKPQFENTNNIASLDSKSLCKS